MLIVNDSKWCPRCITQKPVAEFGVNRGRRDGLTVYCIDCGRAATRASRLKWRRKAIASLGGRCTECGYDRDERALQFDHIHGDGRHERTSGHGCGIRFYRAIVNGDVDGRVQLLCANCNQIKVWEADERSGRRVYRREIPTERDDRPSRRWTPEQRAAQSAKSRAMWDDPDQRANVVAKQTAAANDPERRAFLSAVASENMRRRWASGEIPNRRRS